MSDYRNPSHQRGGGGRPPDRGGGWRPRPDTTTSFKLDANYLKDGYFRDMEQKELCPEIVDTLALDVAKVMARSGLTSHQLRRFFNQIRGIERSIGAQKAFDEVKAEIRALKSSAAYQVGRGMVQEDFLKFIERNVALATENEGNFRRGFIPHFQAVLGFFVYLTRE